jgi:5'-nucleotidase / UDP-sugar diphosphatase
MCLRALIHQLSWILLTVAAHAAAPAGTQALLLIVGDQHSAYERTAQLVARVDRLRTEQAQLPMVMLIDGDVFEHGNVVARRSAGAIDFAMLAALARRIPTVLNLGNHDPEFYDVAETVARLRATGVIVVSNLINRTTGEPFAPAFTRLKLGKQEAVIVGVSTDLLATFRVPVRPTLDLADPVVWARKNFPELLALSPIKVVLSHAGLAADRGLLPLVPPGTLVAGAHDHAAFIHREGKSVYVHSGSWNDSLTLAYLQLDDGGVSWEVRSQRVQSTDPAEPALAELIRATHAKHLTPEDTAVVGYSDRMLSAEEAAGFAARAIRVATGADAAFIGRTTFGAGLPEGAVTRVAFDAAVRFDGTLYIGEVSGEELQILLGRANETPETPFALRRGDFLVADCPAGPATGKRYRIVVTDWIARNPRLYLDPLSIAFTEHPNFRLKALVSAALRPPASAPIK